MQRLRSDGKYGSGDCKFTNQNLMVYTKIQNKIQKLKLSVVAVVVQSDQSSTEDKTLSQRHRDYLVQLTDIFHDIMGQIWCYRVNKTQYLSQFKEFLSQELELMEYILDYEVLPYCESHPEFLTSFSPLSHKFEMATAQARELESLLGETYSESNKSLIEGINPFLNRLSTFLFWMGRLYGDDNYVYWTKFSDKLYQPTDLTS